MEDICKLKRIFQMIFELENFFKEICGLTANEAFTVCLINRGVNSPQEISHELGITISRISRIVGSLEKKGMVKRILDKEDKRKFTFKLTQKGLNKVDIVNQQELKKFIKNHTLLNIIWQSL